FDVNEVAINKLGYSKEEILKMSIFDFLIEEDKEPVRQGLKEIEAIGKFSNYNIFKIKKKDGGIIFLEISGIPLKDTYGKVYAFLGIGHDITMLKEAEQKLTKSKERIVESEIKYRSLFNNSPIGILIFDSKGNLVDRNSTINLRFPEYLGMDFIGKNFREILSFFKDSNQLMQIFSERYKALSKGEPLKPFEFSIITKNNKQVWLNWQSSIVKINNKSFIQVLIQDITDRKEAEKKIRESEEKFRTITEQSFMGITIIQDNIIKYANQAMLDIFGYNLDEVKSWNPLEYLKLFPPESREIIINHERNRLENYDNTVHNYQVRFFKKNSEIGWLELFSNAIIYRGRPASMISIVDITERLEAEKLIIEENQKLLELHEMRKDIINRVSHELKTPLTSIYGASEILMEKLRDEISMNENVLNFMEILYRGAIRLKELVDNLLDSSLLDSKKFELRLKKENLAEIIRGLVYEMKHIAKLREVMLEIDLPDSLFLDVDKLRLRQAIDNLVSNAIKNTPSGGIVVISLREIESYVDIKIKDTGVGITKNEKEKLFEKFGKIERYGMNLDVDIEGSGLGLYISKEIVDLHGGQILVESDGRHKGATFTIRLPKKG
ncbi:MAG: PAS domain S-box protein, partial [Promethearchaeota archaeon]